MRGAASIPTRASRPGLGRFAIVLLAAVLAAGCGDDKPEASSSAPVRVTDHTGKRVELDRPAKRVVTTEWESTEGVLSLGVTPVGVADKGFYDEWVGAGPRIPNEVANVGQRDEPSLEKIAQLRPDLIVVPNDLPAKSIDRMRKIATVVVVDPYPEPKSAAPSEWEQLRDEIVMLGTLLDRRERAEALLARLDRTIAAQRERIEEAERTGDTIVLTQAFTAGKPVARLFDSGSQLIEVARRLGLRNGFDGEHKHYSITEVGLEGLQQIGDADWLLTMTQPNDDPFTGAWKDNPAYRSLPVVERGRVREIGGDTWTWGGTLSAELAAKRIADAVTGAP